MRCETGLEVDETDVEVGIGIVIVAAGVVVVVVALAGVVVGVCRDDVGTGCRGDKSALRCVDCLMGDEDAGELKPREVLAVADVLDDFEAGGG